MSKTRSKTGSRRDDRLAKVARQTLRVVVWVAVIVLGIGAVCAAARRLWQEVEWHPKFRVNPSSLSVPGWPETVRRDAMLDELREEVSVVLEGVSIFEKDLTDSVAHELEASPWVLKAGRIKRELPDKVVAETLVFRKPAAQVRFRGRRWMVSEDGYQLPDTLYREPNAWVEGNYPVVVDDGLEMPPLRAEPWDAPKIAAGAKLFKFLLAAGLFRKLDVDQIDVTSVASGGENSQLVLRCANGARVLWGVSETFAHIEGLPYRPPSNTDEEKLRMLLICLGKYPGLEGIEYVDLRFHTKISYTRRD